LAQIRFDGHVTALAVTDVVDIVFGFQQQSLFGQFLNHSLTRFHAVQALKVFAGFLGHVAVGADDDRQRELMPHGHFIVGRIVRRCHLYATGAELRVHQLVSDDGDGLVLERQQDLPADELRVTRVLRIYRHGLVAEHRFRARRGHDYEFIGFGPALVVEERIFDVPEVSLLLDHLDFLVGERGTGGGVPVHHAFAAIDEALFVKLNEHLLDAARIFRVHGEPFARPVARRAELLELLDDDAAVFFLPLPDAFEEFFAAQVVAMPDFAGLFQRFLDDGLGGDAGVVGAGQPEDFLAVHARLAGEDVLDGVVEDVAHGEHAGDVRRRDDDGIGRTPG